MATLPNTQAPHPTENMWFPARDPWLQAGSAWLKGKLGPLAGTCPRMEVGVRSGAEQEVELQEAGPLSLIEQGSPRCCQQPLGTMKGVSLKSAALLMAEQSVSGNWGCW